MGQTPASALRRQKDSGPAQEASLRSHRVIFAGSCLPEGPAGLSLASLAPRTGRVLSSRAQLAAKPWSPILRSHRFAQALSASRVTRRCEGDGCGERSSRKDETLRANGRCAEIGGEPEPPCGPQSTTQPACSSPARLPGPGEGRAAWDSLTSLLPAPRPDSLGPSPQPAALLAIPAQPGRCAPGSRRVCFCAPRLGGRGRGASGPPPATYRPPCPAPSSRALRVQRSSARPGEGSRLREKGADSGRASVGQPVLGQQAGSNYPLVRLLT